MRSTNPHFPPYRALPASPTSAYKFSIIEPLVVPKESNLKQTGRKHCFIFLLQILIHFFISKSSMETESYLPSLFHLMIPSSSKSLSLPVSGKAGNFAIKNCGFNRESDALQGVPTGCSAPWRRGAHRAPGQRFVCRAPRQIGGWRVVRTAWRMLESL